MDFVKDIVVSLSEGIPVWMRSTFIILIIIFGGLWALGFNYKNIRDIIFLNNIRENSILLSHRAKLDNNKVVNEAVQDLYWKFSGESCGAIGVTIVSFEPEIQPKVLKVIAKNGNKKFEKAIIIGSERYLSGGAMSLFIANREGMTYMSNVHKNKILSDIGVKSVMAMPIIYRGICVGSIVMFFDGKMTDISEENYEFITGSVKIEVHQILEDLYYKKGIWER